MTITKEVSAEQVQGLDLHGGDSLRVLAENASTFLIQIVRAAPVAPAPRRGSASEWARQYLGSAKLEPGETTDVLRMEHLRQKYGT
jgi:hypothetical protein